MNIKLKLAHSLKGTAQVPGDKSISHRALMFGAIADGETRIQNLLQSRDVLSTKKCLEQLGAKITQEKNEFVVHGHGKYSFETPTSTLDCENSGTSMRLLMGLIAGQNVKATLVGDASLMKRPMSRIAEPLETMGAQIRLAPGGFAPVQILLLNQQKLIAAHYDLKIASAQLKSALLLAALYADGVTKLTGKIHSRDHTERMLLSFGVKLSASANEIQMEGGQKLQATSLQVPGDPSSAAFWLAAATLVPHSEIEIQNVSLNPTRTGFLKVLIRMGARIESFEVPGHNEPIGHLRASSAPLKGTEVLESEVASLIDEIPLLAVVATQATGVTTVRGARELRVKESDRIETLALNLRRMGAIIETFDDGFRIEGPQRLHAAKIDSSHDHRIAMSFSIAALIAQGESEICGVDSVGISYPEFYSVLAKLLKD